jgi:uncharacterized repeat protein (TIGR01451 family)
MKRKLVAFTTSLMLLLSVLLVGNVGAHPVIVFDTSTNLFDLSRQEWFASQPSDAGTAMIARNSTNWGEFIFNDFSRDQRLITTTADITRSVDIDWFAITGDPSNISFVVKMDRINGVQANPPPEVMISVSTQAGGQAALPDGVGVTLANDSAWEYVIQTNFSSNLDGNVIDPKIWTGPTASSTCSPCEAQLAGASNGGLPGSFIEIKVPWSRIGGKPAPSNALRFTVTTYYKGHNLSVVPNDGHPTSALIDVASSTKSTKDVLDQGAIQDSFDVHFAADGEVFSPLLISEFNPNPSGSEPGPNGTEWIEIYNPPENNATVQLNDYKIGDTTKKGSSSEAILRFPNKTLAPGDVVIVAVDKSVPPISTVAPAANLTIYNQSQLSKYTTSSGSLGLANSRDQLVLFDGRDTIVDFVEYTSEGNTSALAPNNEPIVFPAGGPPNGNNYSYERCPAASDTNNDAVDFVTHNTFAGSPPTPGVPCPPATGVDLRISKTASPPQVLAGNSVVFFINWFNNGSGKFSSVLVTDTLPANITLLGQSSKPTAIFTPSLGLGQPMAWNFKNLTTNVSGTIVLTASVNTSAPANVPLVNTAGVQSGDPLRPEDLAKIQDGSNFASASVTAIKPDLSVSSTWPGGAQQSANVSYAITYTNHGQGDASDVVITDTLPSVVDAGFIGSTRPPSTVNGNVLTWNIGSLSVSESSTFTVTVKILAAAPKQLTNAIEISGAPADEPGLPSQDNTESRILVVGATPDLQISTTLQNPTIVAPGSQFCFTINYSYPQGAITATGVTIKDTLPAGLTLASQISTPDLTFNGATSGELVWTRASMAVGATGTIVVCAKVGNTVTPGPAGNNLVTIAGSVDPDPNAANNKESKALTFDKYRLYLPIIFN